MREHLYRAALIGRNRHSVRILLDGCPGNLVGTAVVSEVDDLAALALQYSTEYPYRDVMAIEDGRRGYHTQRHASSRGTGDVPRNTVLCATDHGDSDHTCPQECAGWCIMPSHAGASRYTGPVEVCRRSQPSGETISLCSLCQHSSHLWKRGSSPSWVW